MSTTLETGAGWRPPDHPAAAEINQAMTLLGFLDRLDQPMDPTGWQKPGLEPEEIIDQLSLLAHLAHFPRTLRDEARRRAQAIIDRANKRDLP